MTKWLSAKHQFIEYDPDRKDVDFFGNLRRLFTLALFEAFRWQVPVGAHALACEVHLGLILLLHDLAQPEVSDLDLAFVKQHILWLDVIMDNSLCLILEVLDRGDQLLDNQLGLGLRNRLDLLTEDREITSFAVLQHSAEGVFVNLHGVIQLNDVWMIQLSTSLILPQSMLDVVVLSLFRPSRMQLMDLACHKGHSVHVECFVDLRESAFAK